MKFKSLDERYFARRQEFSSATGRADLWTVIDHWPLYCGIANLARFMAIADLLRETLDVPGHVVEFGSWRGSNLMLMAKLLRIWDPHGSKVVHCFDSFEGLQSFTSQDNAAAETQGLYAGSFDDLSAIIALYELEDEIVIHKGDIISLLPAALKADESLSFSFAYCDTDLYTPTHAVLNNLHPRLSKGGLFVLDEWNEARWPGETVAVREFLEIQGGEYELHHIRNSRSPSLVLKKIR
jgi:3-O-methyltransferase